MSAGLCLFACIAMAGAEMDERKTRETKARQLKNGWKIKVHANPDFEVTLPRKMNHAKIAFKRSTNHLQEHPFPSEPCTLSLLRKHSLWARFTPGMGRKALREGSLQLQAKTENGKKPRNLYPCIPFVWWRKWMNISNRTHANPEGREQILYKC